MVNVVKKVNLAFSIHINFELTAGKTDQFSQYGQYSFKVASKYRIIPSNNTIFFDTINFKAIFTTTIQVKIASMTFY